MTAKGSDTDRSSKQADDALNVDVANGLSSDKSKKGKNNMGAMK